MTFDALILCGGAGRRLGGPAKVETEVGGRRLVDRVVGAAVDAGAARVIAVGPAALAGPDVDVVTREEPPGGGPVAAIAAGLRHVTAPRAAVLAADLPLLTGPAIALLIAALDAADLALAVDDSGGDQLLCAAWRTPALLAALAALGPVEGAPVRRLVAHAPTVARLADLGSPPPWFDCDTPDDLARAQRWVASQ